MRNFLAATAVSALMVFSASVSHAQDALTADSVIASVNGTDITLGHVIVLRSQLPQEYQSLPDDVLFEGIISQIVEQTLLADFAEANAEIPREVGLALENERRALYAAVQIEEIAARDVSDEAVQAAYDAQYGNLPAEPEFNASHILVETEEEAQALIVRLEGGADFAELAKEKSTGPSGPNGGELGWFGLGMMVEPFEEAVLEMEVGAISAPVNTQFGWHVLILNEKRNKPAPTLDETGVALMDGLRQAAVEAEIAAMREGADITLPEEGFDAALMRDVSLLEE
ncbi:MAG TPA: peptidylprolyl isomerase [Rhodobacteraceae bacterium]|nr:peptidylprolyl isomerase [Paracoccaceae bacterium]